MAFRRIEEDIVEGKRLGRHVNHDPRSLRYKVQVPPMGVTPLSSRWNRDIPVLDQGSVGSCTGNAAIGHLGTDPDYSAVSQVTGPVTLDETGALIIYSDAERIDGGVGYPPEDNGSSGLSAAQACLNRKLIAGYTHITSIDEAHVAIQQGPFIQGTNWYSGFDTPDATGVVAIAADATVRGGHEYACIGYDAASDLWEYVNSWGTGWGVSGRFFMNTATLQRLLSEEGDATQFVPLGQPAPVPTPAPQPATVKRCSFLRRVWNRLT